uniref:Uncharacterized protein n=1 Tax=Zea mays TaxID=4577 RepID=C0HHC2_MAIZE|nr:unknown [Zea mays]
MLKSSTRKGSEWNRNQHKANFTDDVNLPTIPNNLPLSLTIPFAVELVS